VHEVPLEEHEAEDDPAVADAVYSRIGSADPPEFHPTTSDESDAWIPVMTGAFGSGATVKVSTPRVPAKPAASLPPENNNDVTEDPAESCDVPIRRKSVSRNDAIRGPDALSVVAYSVPVESSSTRLRAPISPVFKVTDAITVWVGISIAVIRPGFASVPRYAVVPTTIGSIKAGVPAGSDTTEPMTSLFRVTETNLMGFVLTAASSSLPLGMNAVISLSPVAKVELNSRFPLLIPIFMTFAGFWLVPMM
jgi:hypothetical protein